MKIYQIVGNAKNVYASFEAGDFLLNTQQTKKKAEAVIKADIPRTKILGNNVKKGQIDILFKSKDTDICSYVQGQIDGRADALAFWGLHWKVDYLELRNYSEMGIFFVDDDGVPCSLSISQKGLDGSDWLISLKKNVHKKVEECEIVTLSKKPFYPDNKDSSLKEVEVNIKDNQLFQAINSKRLNYFVNNLILDAEGNLKKSSFRMMLFAVKEENFEYRVSDETMNEAFKKPSEKIDILAALKAGGDVDDEAVYTYFEKSDTEEAKGIDFLLSKTSAFLTKKENNKAFILHKQYFRSDFRGAILRSLLKNIKMIDDEKEQNSLIDELNSFLNDYDSYMDSKIEQAYQSLIEKINAHSKEATQENLLHDIYLLQKIDQLNGQIILKYIKQVKNIEQIKEFLKLQEWVAENINGIDDPLLDDIYAIALNQLTTEKGSGDFQQYNEMIALLEIYYSATDFSCKDYRNILILMQVLPIASKKELVNKLNAYRKAFGENKSDDQVYEELVSYVDSLDEEDVKNKIKEYLSHSRSIDFLCRVDCSKEAVLFANKYTSESAQFRTFVAAFEEIYKTKLDNKFYKTNEARIKKLTYNHAYQLFNNGLQIEGDLKEAIHSYIDMIDSEPEKFLSENTTLLGDLLKNNPTRKLIIEIYDRVNLFLNNQEQKQNILKQLSAYRTAIAEGKGDWQAYKALLDAVQQISDENDILDKNRLLRELRYLRRLDFVSRAVQDEEILENINYDETVFYDLVTLIENECLRLEASLDKTDKAYASFQNNKNIFKKKVYKATYDYLKSDEKDYPSLVNNLNEAFSKIEAPLKAHAPQGWLDKLRSLFDRLIQMITGREKQFQPKSARELGIFKESFKEQIPQPIDKEEPKP
jgi:hypothetical protein